MHDPHHIISIQLNIRKSNPNLLEGLDTLLRLGLVSDEQVRQLCQEYLTSPLPPFVVAEFILELIPGLVLESSPEPTAEIPPPLLRPRDCLTSSVLHCPTAAASWLSAIALVMANLIILESPIIRLIGFAVAAVLMLINTA